MTPAKVILGGILAFIGLALLGAILEGYQKMKAQYEARKKAGRP
jgi:hypothetical protein